MWRTHDEVRAARREVGVEEGDADELRRRQVGLKALEAVRAMAPEEERAEADPLEGLSPAEVASKIVSDLLDRGRSLLRWEGVSSAGRTARILLALALFLFPMALLAATKLQSAYAGLHLPLLLPSFE